MGHNLTNLSSNVHEVAARQGGHITRQQMLELGMTGRTIARWVAAGHLLRIYRGVYAVGHIPANPIDRAHAALLAGGDRAVLSHACALVLWGFWKDWPQRPVLTLAIDRRPSGITIHRSTTLMLRDVREREGLRVTSPARTALDFAATAGPKRLKAAVDHLRLRHGMRLEQLSDVAARNPYHRGAEPLRALIGTAEARPSRSGFERQWPAFAKRHQLPAYQQNTVVAGHEVDILIEGVVIVELDTRATHLLNFDSDRERDATILAATGIPTIRATADQFNAQPLKLAQRIRDTVARRLRDHD